MHSSKAIKISDPIRCCNWVADSGVISHLLPSKWEMTPESATQLQHRIGADIIMAFDECIPYPSPEDYVEQSVERTTRWAERCLRTHRQLGREKQQALYGIVQGSNFPHLREKSVKQLLSL